MAVPRLTSTQAKARLRDCLEAGFVQVTRHFREELAYEHLTIDTAYAVLNSGNIYDAPEQDIKSGDWKYRIEGFTSSGIWLALVFCFRELNNAILITVFSVNRRI